MRKKSQSFDEIYEQHLNDLYHYLFSLVKRKEAAEDLVQETFYRALIHLESYKGEEIRPWLFRIAYNSFIDFYRKEKRMVPSVVEEWHLPSSRSAEEEVMVKSEILEWQNALDVLSIPMKNIVLLRDFYGFSYQEIAELTGYTIGKIKMDLFRGRKEVKKARESNNDV